MTSSAPVVQSQVQVWTRKAPLQKLLALSLGLKYSSGLGMQRSLTPRKHSIRSYWVGTNGTAVVGCTLQKLEVTGSVLFGQLQPECALQLMHLGWGWEAT